MIFPKSIGEIPKPIDSQKLTDHVIWRDVQLPLYLFVQNNAIGSILGSKGFATILHAEHQQRFCAIVANRALAGWSHSYHAALLAQRQAFSILTRTTRNCISS